MTPPKPDRFDLDRDGVVTDEELAFAPVPSIWRRFGLRGPAVIFRWIGRNAKRMAVAVIGFAVLAAGVAMIVLPGPGVIVIIVGLAILATEFAWAERALDRTTMHAARTASQVNETSGGRVAMVITSALMGLGGLALVFAVAGWNSVGVGLIVGAIAGLATIHPRSQRWMDRRLDAKRVE